MRIEVFSRKKMFKRRQWYFRVLSSNGQTVAQSEGYYNREDCIETCSNMRRELVYAHIMVLEEDE